MNTQQLVDLGQMSVFVTVDLDSNEVDSLILCDFRFVLDVVLFQWFSFEGGP